MPYGSIDYAKLSQASGDIVIFCCYADTVNRNVVYSSNGPTFLEIAGLKKARPFHEAILRLAPHVQDSASGETKMRAGVITVENSSVELVQV